MDDVIKIGFSQHNSRQDNVLHYKPTIDEFHDGFEFKVLDFDHNLVDFIFVPEVASKHTEFSIYEKWIENNQVRVKFLDKEDIESLGFKLNGDISTEKFRLNSFDTAFNYTFNKDDIEILYINWFTEGRVQKNRTEHRIVKIFNTSNIDSSGKPIQIFSGVIKNKSEFKKLLKQLGINE